MHLLHSPCAPSVAGLPNVPLLAQHDAVLSQTLAGATTRLLNLEGCPLLSCTVPCCPSLLPWLTSSIEQDITAEVGTGWPHCFQGQAGALK